MDIDPSTGQSTRIKFRITRFPATRRCHSSLSGYGTYKHSRFLCNLIAIITAEIGNLLNRIWL